jgi:hypothetical protein
MGDVLLGSDPQLGIRASGTRSREWYLVRRDPLALTAVREPLREAYASGKLSKERLSDMVRASCARCLQ